MKKIYKQLFILLPFVILFSSCVDMTRNIVLNKDGSGTEKMNLVISNEFFRMMKGLAELDTTAKKKDVYNDSAIIAEIKKNFTKNDIIVLNDVISTMTADSSKNLLVDYSFNKLSAIALALDDDEAAKSKSQIYMQEQGDVIKFYYEMANQDEPADTTSNDLSTKMFEGKQFTLNIEFPYDVISSNATSQDGRKLTWVRPMTIISKPGSKEIFEAELRK